MSEPRRLLEDSESATEQALLHAGRSYRSSRETRAKTLAALGIASSTAVAAAGSASASLTGAKVTGAKLLTAKLLVAVSVAGAVSLAPVAYHLLHERDTNRTTVAAPAARSTPIERAESVPVPPLVEAPVALSEGTLAPAAGRPPARVAEPVSLAQELVALDAVRATMAGGDAQGALLLLDGYAKTCPQGRLRLEAELLRIDALAKSGQTQAARRRAEAFLRRHPGSVLAARARGYTETRGSLDH